MYRQTDTYNVSSLCIDNRYLNVSCVYTQTAYNVSSIVYRQTDTYNVSSIVYRQTDTYNVSSLSIDRQYLKCFKFVYSTV